jgi:maleate isomerase
MAEGSTATTALGMITPSSNTVLEPMTYAMLADLGSVSAHFARIRVTEITTGDAALAQFDNAPMLAAASLLADARVQAIAWNGTSASWLGFARDVELCRAIETETGIPATTSVLGINAALQGLGARRLAIVTPYLADIQARIVANYEAAGFDVVAERHLDDPGNYSFAEHDEPCIEALIREVADARPEAIAIVCTNFRGTRIAARLEQELGIPIIDSIAATLWHSLALAGMASADLAAWGRVFRLPCA